MDTDSNTNIINIKPSTRTLTIFFIVDVSGDMWGERIAIINEAFIKIISDMCQFQLESPDNFKLKITILACGPTANWLVEPTPILEYNRKTIQCTPYAADYGEAFETLERQLHRNAYLHCDGMLYEPIIFLLTSGSPAEYNYGPQLKKLKDNIFFKHSKCFAFLIGDAAANSRDTEEFYNQFASGPDDVINVQNAAELSSGIESILDDLASFISFVSDRNSYPDFPEHNTTPAPFGDSAIASKDLLREFFEGAVELLGESVELL